LFFILFRTVGQQVGLAHQTRRHSLRDKFKRWH